MARLNDPPAPAAESVDALKRRFIRQNREIARVNSTQSQRIRNLETEISRLLAENISLREQAIAASAEAEKWRTSSRLGRDVIELKSRLADRLYEVTALVEELGGLPEKAARRGSTRQRKSRIAQGNTQSSDEKDWVNKQPISTASVAEGEGQEGRLPAILEDKYYPRRTLETDELHHLTAVMNDGNEDSESPDLGPPPTVHFEVSDPIAFDSAKSPKRVSGGLVSTDEETWALSRNLETRRKRRTSSLIHEMSALQDEAEEEKHDVSTKSTARTRAVAKRKFEASEMDVEENASDRNDGFEYQRRDSSATTRPKPSRFAPRPSSRDQHTSMAGTSTSPQKSSDPRKILAPKSTNSPTKKTVTAAPLEKTNVVKDEISGPNKLPNRRRMLPKPIHITTMDPSPAENVDLSDRDAQYPPKTPAASLEDMISPPSSVVETLSKKPIEAAITNSVEDVLNGSIGRGSRRAKAAVSYAEPNLRDKMRRPDKKLVGAVEGLNKPINTTERDFSRETTHEQSLEPGQSISSMKVITIKPEKTLEGEPRVRWKDLPEAETNDEVGSPLKGREKSAAARIYEARKKRTHSESEGTKRTPTKAHSVIDDELDKAVSRLSIFDPPNSSPVSSKTVDREVSKSDNIIPDHPTADTKSITERPTSAASNTRTRRHSVQLSANSHPTVPKSATEKPSLTRTSSVVSMRDVGGKENVSLATSKLKRASSVQNMDAAKTIGSRRRSMMV